MMHEVPFQLSSTFYTDTAMTSSSNVMESSSPISVVPVSSFQASIIGFILVLIPCIHIKLLYELSFKVINLHKSCNV